MHRSLKVAAIATDVTPDFSQNLRNAELLAMNQRRKADVIVLPELFATGFPADRDLLRQYADTADRHPVADWMRSLAERTNAAVCGSVATVADDGSLRNRCLFVEPGGETSFYDKRHLFRLSREYKSCTAGTAKSPVIRFRGCNIALAVCYDLRFPTWMRNNAHSPYDVIIVPAAWPQERQLAWSTLLAARAIENQAFIVGANRAGTDNFGTYDAMSMAFDPEGAPVGTYDPASQSLLVNMEMDALDALRTKFPVLEDAD